MPRRLGLLLLVALVFPGCGQAAQHHENLDRAAVDAARAFLSGYVDPDGRVVRRDQGSDTVGEGQAYAMLAAAAIGDRAAFDRVWGWTQANLLRPDGLLAFHWAGGRVVDSQAASDADLDAARALMVAGCRLGRGDLRAAAGRIGRSVLARETRGHVLGAGPWALKNGVTVFNPSYLDPRTLIGLGHLTGDHRYAAVAREGRRLIGALAQPLPPNWANVNAAGAARATGVFSWDAPRTLVRLAADPQRAGRRIAARAWPAFRGRRASRIVVVHNLNGAPAGRTRHPVTLVAAAGAAKAAGHRDDAVGLLDAATALNQAQPTYYGTAWVALGRLLLTTHRLDVRPC
jgi:endoglucanase